MTNPYPITPRQLNLVDLSGSHLTEQGVYPDIKMGVVASYNVSNVSAETVLKSTASGGLTLGSLNVQGNSTLRNVLPESPDTYDLGSSINLWRKGWLSELDTIIFAENTAALVGGWLIIGKDQGSIPSFVDSSDTIIDFGKTMIVGGSVVFRSSLQVEYIGMGSLASGSTVYNVVRDLDGTGANDWVEGSVFLALGESGDGRIELNAYDTPRIQMIQQGETYNQQKEIIRIGDLNGNWNYSSEEWGVAIGSYGSGSGNITIDSINGVKINIYDTPIMEFKSTGAFISNVLNMTGGDAAIAIGFTPPSGSSVGTGLWLDRTGLYAVNSGIQEIVLNQGELVFGYRVIDEYVSPPEPTLPEQARNWGKLNNTGIKFDLIYNPLSLGIKVPMPRGNKIQWVDYYHGAPDKHYFDIGAEVQGEFSDYLFGTITAYNFSYPDVADAYADARIVTSSRLGETSQIIVASGKGNDGIYFSSPNNSIIGNLNPWQKLLTFLNSLTYDTYYFTIQYVSSTSIRISRTGYGDITSWFPTGTKIKFTQTTVKYFYVLSATYSGGYTTITLNGGGTYTVADASISDFYYSHAAVADGMPFGSSTFIPLTTPLTSTSWDGDSFSTTAKTKIDLSAVFGVPAGVKAVQVRLFCQDSASSSNGGLYFGVGGNNTAGDMSVLARPIGIANDYRVEGQGICACDANGDIYYQCVASGAGTLDVWIQIFGYWI